MVNEKAEIGISKRAVKAKPGEIIEPGKKPEKQIVELELVREVFPEVPKTMAPPPPIQRKVTVLSSTKTLSEPVPDKKRLILNIETLGLKPWEKRIITIGIQDPLEPDIPPIIIMEEDEEMMINTLMQFITAGGYDELVGYNLSFDYRFIVLRAMFYGIALKEFADMTIYDLMQAMAQVKFAFVYNAQKPPSLSDIADFFFSYPKPFSDLEMMKFYTSGRLDKVLEFASGQITRTLLLYSLFRNITENDFGTFNLDNPGKAIDRLSPEDSDVNSNPGLPNNPGTETKPITCSECLADIPIIDGKLVDICPICKTVLK